jgi:hypothetical protein
MNAATIENSNAVRVWTQSNANTTLSSQVVSGLATTYFGTHTSLAPNGQNWTGRADTRMQSGWRSGNTLGFM